MEFRYYQNGITCFLFKVSKTATIRNSYNQGGPPRGFGEQGKKDIYFRGTWEQRSNFEGNKGTKTILGNREHKKTNFWFFGNRETSQFISGEQGNRYPTPWEGLIKYHTWPRTPHGKVIETKENITYKRVKRLAPDHRAAMDRQESMTSEKSGLVDEFTIPCIMIVCQNIAIYRFSRIGQEHFDPPS